MTEMKQQENTKFWLFNTPIAHRGLHDDVAPENSFAAAAKAIEKGYPIELDVHLTKDEKVVVFHDDNLKRMTGVDREIEDCTWEELSELKLGDSEERIPLFEDFLKFVDGRVPLLIEIKQAKAQTGYLELFTYRLLEHYKGDYAIQSFNPFSVNWFKENEPDVIRGILSCFYKNSNMSKIRRWLLKAMMFNTQCQPDFLSYCSEDLPNKYVARDLSSAPCICWTVRSQEEADRVRPYVRNIIFENFIPVWEPKSDEEIAGEQEAFSKRR